MTDAAAALANVKDIKGTCQQTDRQSDQHRRQPADNKGRGPPR